MNKKKCDRLLLVIVHMHFRKLYMVNRNTLAVKHTFFMWGNNKNEKVYLLFKQSNGNWQTKPLTKRGWIKKNCSGQSWIVKLDFHVTLSLLLSEPSNNNLLLLSVRFNVPKIGVVFQHLCYKKCFSWI